MAVTWSHSRSSRPRPGASGFSLVEAAVSMAIVAGLLLAALSTLGATAKRQRAEVDRDLTLVLAHALMGEILQAHYEDPDEETPLFGPEGGEATSRSDFDDVDDYDGWSADPPETRDGRPLTAFAGYTRSVSIAFVGPENVEAVGSQAAVDDRGLKRITVTVQRSGGAVATLTGLRSRPSSYDREPATESTYVRWVGVTLQLGAEGTPLESGTSVVNQVPIGGDP